MVLPHLSALHSSSVRITTTAVATTIQRSGPLVASCYRETNTRQDAGTRAGSNSTVKRTQLSMTKRLMCAMRYDFREKSRSLAGRTCVSLETKDQRETCRFTRNETKALPNTRSRGCVLTRSKNKHKKWGEYVRKASNKPHKLLTHAL